MPTRFAFCPLESAEIGLVCRGSLEFSCTLDAVRVSVWRTRPAFAFLLFIVNGPLHASPARTSPTLEMRVAFSRQQAHYLRVN